jgi:hypothetical protein
MVGIFPKFSIFIGNNAMMRGFCVVKPELITIKEVADFLQIAEKTVYRLAAEGKIPAFKVGGAWRFNRKEIQTWLEKQRNDKK